MPKLYNIFLKKFILLFASLFILLGIVVYFWIKNIYLEETKKDLLNNIQVISLLITDLKNADAIASSVSQEIKLRVTIIDKTGTVIAESDEDKATMDNHRNRPEIIQAIYQEYGTQIRNSNTLQKDMLYVAKKFTLNNQEYFIRMASEIEKVNEKFISLSFKIGLIFFIFIALAFLIALNISSKIESETHFILEFLNNLKSKKSKKKQITSTYSFEFQKITKLLNDVATTLDKRSKQKAKYTAKLKLANRQKDDIISAISHEFKNPIAVINGYTQTLLEDTELNSKIREKFLQKILANSNKMTTMINRLRLSLKLEEGDYQENFTKIDLYPFVQNIVDDLTISYPNREISISSEKDITIEADSTMLSIAIENLIENALKYSQENIIIEIKQNSISVIDHGIGIKEKDIANITQRFYRVSNNGWNNSLGLGLSLVSNILKTHQFTLEIESVENEGSTFRVKFS